MKWRVFNRYPRKGRALGLATIRSGGKNLASRTCQLGARPEREVGITSRYGGMTTEIANLFTTKAYLWQHEAEIPKPSEAIG